MNEVMLDLETMGTGSNAAIIAIGAVRFDTGTQETTDEFYEVVDLQSCVDFGLEIDPSTVMWWMRQSDEARKEFERRGEPLHVVLLNFEAWLGEDAVVWGNGAAFDNTILANAYRKCAIKQPWMFWDDRCYRTMKCLYPEVPFVRLGDHHNAVDDARSQAEHLMRIIQAMDGEQ